MCFEIICNSIEFSNIILYGSKDEDIGDEPAWLLLGIYSLVICPLPSPHYCWTVQPIKQHHLNNSSPNCFPLPINPSLPSPITRNCHSCSQRTTQLFCTLLLSLCVSSIFFDFNLTLLSLIYWNAPLYFPYGGLFKWAFSTKFYVECYGRTLLTRVEVLAFNCCN